MLRRGILLGCDNGQGILHKDIRPQHAFVNRDLHQRKVEVVHKKILLKLPGDGSFDEKARLWTAIVKCSSNRRHEIRSDRGTCSDADHPGAVPALHALIAVVAEGENSACIDKTLSARFRQIQASAEPVE